MKFFRSIRTKIMSLQIGIIILCFICFGLSIDYFIGKSIRELRDTNIRYISWERSDQFKHRIDDLRGLFQNIAMGERIEVYSWKYEDTLMMEYFLKYSNPFNSLSFISSEGLEEFYMKNGAPILEGHRNFSGNALFNRALKAPNKVIAQIETPGKDFSEARMSFIYQRMNFFDETIAFLYGEIPLRYLTEEIRNFTFSNKGFILLLDSEGKILSHPQEDDSLGILRLHGDNFRDVFARSMTNKTESFRVNLKDEKCDDCYVALSPVEGYDLSVMAVLPYDEFIQMQTTFRKILVVLFLFLSVLAIVLSSATSFTISRPLLELVEIIRKTRKENLPQSISIRSTDEVGILADAFNEMIQELSDTMNSLENEISMHMEALTEKKRMEALLLQSQKMRAIGSLTGGIAHDFNNILYPILGFAQMTIKTLPKDSVAYKNLEEIITAAKRAKSLVSQILALSRSPSREQKPIILKPIIEEVLKLIEPTLPSTIEIKLDIDKKCGYILGDSDHIYQVLLNLCTNAYQAIGPDYGILTIRLEEVNISITESISDGILAPGSYARISVQDTGHGMDRDTMEKIFEPYFTTKEVGKGSGLGLSVAHGIVKNHGGAIIPESELGVGSVFHVFLPIISSSSEEIKVAQTGLSKELQANILVVEDETDTTLLLHQTIIALGCSVTHFNKSLEAIEEFTSDPEKFDLVIVDLGMPIIPGNELARRLLNIRLDIPIIVLAGNNEPLQSKKMPGVREMLTKPVDPEHLSEIVISLLDKQVSTGQIENI